GGNAGCLAHVRGQSPAGRRRRKLCLQLPALQSGPAPDESRRRSKRAQSLSSDRRRTWTDRFGEFRRAVVADGKKSQTGYTRVRASRRQGLRNTRPCLRARRFRLSRQQPVSARILPEIFLDFHGNRSVITASGQLGTRSLRRALAFRVAFSVTHYRDRTVMLA